MSGLFSQNNLLLCAMQGNNGLLGKTLKTFPKSPTSQPVLTFDKCQICSASRCVWINIYRVTLQQKKFITFLFYLMVLLCVIFKALDMRGILSTPESDVHVRLKTTGTAMKIARETTNLINKRIIIQWNGYKDNNFHSRIQVLGVKCL